MSAFDAIVLHTSFFAIRWTPEAFDRFPELAARIADCPAVKIALPQDEFYLSDRLAAMIDAVGADWVLSCAAASERAEIYRDVRHGVRFKPTLTGYLDERVVARLNARMRPLAARPINIGYRAWDAAYWLGTRGQDKVRIAREFKAAAQARGMNVDISLADSDTIAGSAWFDFLMSCRGVIGVEGGASILDRDGGYRDAVDAFLAERPDATFEETKRAVLASADDTFGLSCLSPRHLEAAATRTAQLLLIGGYNGILGANDHYIAIARDYSNMGDALDRLSDDGFVSALTNRAYDEVVAGGRYTYRAFVRDVEAEIIDPHPGVATRLLAMQAAWINNKDMVHWRIIQAECAFLANPARFRPYRRLLKPAYLALTTASRGAARRPQ